jgi:hypothetical protein
VTVVATVLPTWSVPVTTSVGDEVVPAAQLKVVET